MKQNFEVKIFTSDRYSSNNPNLLARIRNQLITAIDKHQVLPRVILVVLDRDFSSAIHFEDFGLSLIMGTQLNWLAKEFNRIIAVQKDRLQPRSIKDDWPKIIWMAAPLHINFPDNKYRDKFNKALANILKFYPDMIMMRLVKEFLYADSTCYIKEANRFTSAGLHKYWSSIDSAVEHWAKCLAPTVKKEQNLGTPKFVKKMKFEFNKGSNRFKWNNYDGKGKGERRKLPQPPPQ